MGYLYKQTDSKHSKFTLILETVGDVEELEFFLRHGIEACKGRYLGLSAADPEILRAALSKTVYDLQP